ncbi:class I adenylate-forming enzyme family protein [Mycobacterium paraterrae]|uniref:Acyl--CoA ligase n=1 Tax=Mycobacterium paraterrae TaxID=577492 RepID=A0ABY3VSS5_9MYCO|nr:class I adenylate-forming enzyme family protein [Mycobacterium paraterrae]UMB71122.1 acyl--CoA ligase [Mycobacterium paraterrae]
MLDTIDALVRKRAVDHPTKPMVIDTRHRLTYRELDCSTADLAAAFIDAGVGKGSRVGLIMPNCARWVQIAIALTRIGAVLVPLSTLLAARELVAQLHSASVQYLISVEEFRGHRYLDHLATALAVSDLDGTLHCTELPALRRVWNADRLPEGSGGSFVDAVAATVTPSDTMAVIFTSGSSGPPKGVLHSHGGALGAVRAGLASRCIDADTRLYLPMPFFWVGGFASGVLSALVAGATLITEEIPQSETTLQLLERERVTLFRGWPDQAETLARHPYRARVDLSALRPGSLEALLPPDQRPQPGSRAMLFGMTEAFGPYCGYPADTDMPRSAWDSCGKPFPGMEIRITDTGDGRTLAPGAVGMIQLRGPHTLRGICRRRREEIFTADGFYPTGDLGHLDDDGFLFYHGRSDDMFKVSGATVYPVEVEQALRQIDGVGKAFVTNVAGAQGVRVGAAVVCDTASVTVEQLREQARRLLSPFKVPTVWLLADEETIPRGPTGKLDVRRLREMLAEAAAH